MVHYKNSRDSIWSNENTCCSLFCVFFDTSNKCKIMEYRKHAIWMEYANLFPNYYRPGCSTQKKGYLRVKKCLLFMLCMKIILWICGYFFYIHLYIRFFFVVRTVQVCGRYIKQNVLSIKIYMFQSVHWIVQNK